MEEFESASDIEKNFTESTAKTSKLSVNDIVEKIYSAVLEHRLPPNTKLSESTLCESFGVGRMKVRQALLLLSSQGIVNLQSNRGAFIACPNRKESKDVFGARLAIEPSVVRQVVMKADEKKFKILEALIYQEQESRDKGDRRESIRLSGEFHVQLAAATGNVVIKRMVRELVTRTSLIVGLFGTYGDNNCPEHEHLNILTALHERNAAEAAKLVYQHLEHIEASLNLSSVVEQQLDISRILRG